MSIKTTLVAAAILTGIASATPAEAVTITENFQGPRNTLVPANVIPGLTLSTTNTADPSRYQIVATPTDNSAALQSTGYVGPNFTFSANPGNVINAITYNFAEFFSPGDNTDFTLSVGPRSC